VLAAGSASPAESADETKSPDSWVATGDSYSSGTGIPSAAGDCLRAEELAYPGLVRQRLTAGAGSLDPWRFTACSGHRSRDLYNTRDADGFHGPLSDEAGLGGQRVDLITLTFGGNDIGFADVIFDCLGIDTDELKDATATGATSGIVADDVIGAWTRSYGCEVGEDELSRRVEALGDPSQPLPRDAGQRLPDDTPGSLAEFYRHIHDEHLTEDGHLVVLGYPQLFAPSNEWDGWFGAVCSGFRRSEADMLRRVGEELNAQLRDQVDAAAGGGRNIHYLPVAPAFDGHERCSEGDPFLHGFSLVNRGRGSFHPNPTGHFQMAELLDTRIHDLYSSQPRHQASCADPEVSQEIEQAAPEIDGNQFHSIECVADMVVGSWPVGNIGIHSLVFIEQDGGGWRSVFDDWTRTAEDFYDTASDESLSPGQALDVAEVVWGYRPSPSLQWHTPREVMDAILQDLEGSAEHGLGRVMERRVWLSIKHWGPYGTPKCEGVKNGHVVCRIVGKRTFDVHIFRRDGVWVAEKALRVDSWR
jgi:hypothetical protein